MDPTAESKCRPGWIGDFLLLLAAAGLPLCLAWDFSWESTIGIDLPWSPPHGSLFAMVLLAGVVAAATIRRPRGWGVPLLGWEAPLGMWVALWGALVFGANYWFDRWWQAGYGVAAGLWHPAQLLKAVAFGGVLLGAWLRAAGKIPLAIAGAAWLAYLSVITLPQCFANRQHSAAFYEMAAAVYPMFLVAQSQAGSGRFPATMAATGYLLLWGGLVWLLPLFPAHPQIAPIFQPRDHLLPPPFPLWLVVPAFAIDLLRRKRSFALEAGLAFALLFGVVQWLFAAFLLSPFSQGWFFAGGGREWPFFLQISPGARTAFWLNEGPRLGLPQGLMTIGLALISAQLGHWIGQWRSEVRR